jgi:Domain associated at C-terminal with AAA
MGVESWAAAGVGPAIASLMFIYPMVKHHLPSTLTDYVTTIFNKLLSIINPYGQIAIHEYCGENMQRDELYTAAQAYLSSNCSSHARKLKAELGRDSDTPLVSIGDYEEVVDTTFRQGIKVWWYACTHASNTPTISFYPREEERKYVLII